MAAEGREPSCTAECDFFSVFCFFPIAGSSPGAHVGRGGGLTVRPLPLPLPLPPSPPPFPFPASASITRSANRGRGRMRASHHVSADSQRCLPLGSTDAVPVAARRFGVDMDALRLSRVGRLAGRRYAGALGLRARGSRSCTVNLGVLARDGGGGWTGWGVEAESGGTAGVA